MSEAEAAQLLGVTTAELNSINPKEPDLGCTWALRVKLAIAEQD